MGYSPWDCRESDVAEVSTHAHTQTQTMLSSHPPHSPPTPSLASTALLFSSMGFPIWMFPMNGPIQGGIF